jgi:POTRA domain, FtsQ-type
VTATMPPPTIDPRMWRRRVEVTRAKGRRRLRLLVVALLVCVLGLGGLVAIHTSLFSARHLSVEGAVHTPPGEILAAAGLLAHPPLVDIDAGADAARVEALPWIDVASVRTHWPDSVSVVVTERSAVATVEPLVSSASGTNAAAGSTRPKARSTKTRSTLASTWALVDPTGRVLQDLPSKPAGTVELKVPAAAAAPGSYLSALDQPGVEVAASLPSSIGSRVEWISVSRTGEVELGMRGGISVVMGPAVDLSSKYEALASVLAGAALGRGDVIDVTVPQEPTVQASTAGRGL